MDAKKKKNSLLSILPLDCWSCIVEYLSNTKDFFSVVFSAKGFYEYCQTINPKCTRNIPFNLQRFDSRPQPRNHVTNFQIMRCLNNPIQCCRKFCESELGPKFSSIQEVFSRIFHDFPNLSQLRIEFGKLVGAESSEDGRINYFKERLCWWTNFPLLGDSHRPVALSLKKLTLRISSSDLRIEKNFPRLEDLSISFAGNFVRMIDSRITVHEISFSGNLDTFTKKLWIAWEKMPNVENVNLFYWELMTAVKGNRIKELTLDNCKLGHKDKVIHNLPKLKRLELKRNTSSQINGLSDLSDLEALSITWTGQHDDWSEHGFERFKYREEDFNMRLDFTISRQFQSLRIIEIVGIKNKFQFLSPLASIGLGNSHQTINGRTTLCLNDLPNLETVRFIYFSHPVLLSNLPKLESVNFKAFDSGRISRLRDRGSIIVELENTGEALRELRLSGNLNLGDALETRLGEGDFKDTLEILDLGFRVDHGYNVKLRLRRDERKLIGELSGYVKLKELSCFGNSRIYRFDLKRVFDCPELKKLVIDFHLDNPPQLSNLPNLREVYFRLVGWRSGKTDTLMETLKQEVYSSLRKLEIGKAEDLERERPKVRGGASQYSVNMDLSKLPFGDHLESVSLFRIEDVIVSSCPCLKTIFLGGVRSFYVENLEKLKKIEIIKAEEGSITNNPSLEYVSIEQTQQLTSIEVNPNTRFLSIESRLPKKLGLFPKVKYLELRKALMVEIEGTSFPTLERLSIAEMYDLLVKNLPNLRNLAWSGWDVKGRQDVEIVNCPNLKEVDLRNFGRSKNGKKIKTDLTLKNLPKCETLKLGRNFVGFRTMNIENVNIKVLEVYLDFFEGLDMLYDFWIEGSDFPLLEVLKIKDGRPAQKKKNRIIAIDGLSKLSNLRTIRIEGKAQFVHPCFNEVRGINLSGVRVRAIPINCDNWEWGLPAEPLIPKAGEVFQFSLLEYINFLNKKHNVIINCKL